MGGKWIEGGYSSITPNSHRGKAQTPFRGSESLLGPGHQAPTSCASSHMLSASLEAAATPATRGCSLHSRGRTGCLYPSLTQHPPLGFLRAQLSTHETTGGSSPPSWLISQDLGQALSLGKPFLPLSLGTRETVILARTAPQRSEVQDASVPPRVSLRQGGKVTGARTKCS